MPAVEIGSLCGVLRGWAEVPRLIGCWFSRWSCGCDDLSGFA